MKNPLSYLFPKRTAAAVPTTAQQHFLAIVFRNRDTLLFDRFRGTDKPAPVILPHDSAAQTAEEDLQAIQAYLFSHFKIDPDNASLSLAYHCTSLAPISPTTFSLVYVEINDADFDRLKPRFIPLTAAQIMLEREHNLFFDLIARDYFAVP